MLLGLYPEEEESNFLYPSSLLSWVLIAQVEALLETIHVNCLKLALVAELKGSQETDSFKLDWI